MYSRDRSRTGGLFGIRKLGWAAVASMLAIAMIGPGVGVVLGATQGWGGNGWPVKSACDETPAGTTVWIWTGDSPTALTVNGVAHAGSWVQAGGGSSSYKFTSPWFATEPDHATTFVTFTGDAGTLTITHGCAPEPGPDADADAGRHPDAVADADAGRHPPRARRRPRRRRRNTRRRRARRRRRRRKTPRPRARPRRRPHPHPHPRRPRPPHRACRRCSPPRATTSRT